MPGNASHTSKEPPVREILLYARVSIYISPRMGDFISIRKYNKYIDYFGTNVEKASVTIFPPFGIKTSCFYII